LGSAPDGSDPAAAGQACDRHPAAGQASGRGLVLLAGIRVLVAHSGISLVERSNGIIPSRPLGLPGNSGSVVIIARQRFVGMMTMEPGREN